MCCVLWTLCHTIQHRAVLIIFPLYLQTITITLMLSSGGEGDSVKTRTRLHCVLKERWKLHHEIHTNVSSSFLSTLHLQTVQSVHVVKARDIATSQTCRLRKNISRSSLYLLFSPQQLISRCFACVRQFWCGHVIYLAIRRSVIFVNENENEDGEKRENNEFVNEN